MILFLILKCLVRAVVGLEEGVGGGGALGWGGQGFSLLEQQRCTQDPGEEGAGSEMLGNGVSAPRV